MGSSRFNDLTARRLADWRTGGRADEADEAGEAGEAGPVFGAGTPPTDVVDHHRAPVLPHGSHRNIETVQVVEIFGSRVYDSDMKEKNDAFKHREAKIVSKLTPEVANDIEDLVMRGSYPWVAAATCGVTRETFSKWRRKSETDPFLKIFFNRLEVAEAQARGTAEQEVLSTQPATWLTKGPGRNAGPDGEAGWGEKVEIEHKGGPVRVEVEFVKNWTGKTE